MIELLVIIGSVFGAALGSTWFLSGKLATMEAKLSAQAERVGRLDERVDKHDDRIRELESAGA